MYGHSAVRVHCRRGAPDSVPYVKLNRQGSLRLQVYKKQGTGWQRSGDLRGLVAIEVLK